MLRTLLPLTVGLGALAAQETLTAHHFLLQGYKTVVHADLVAMRDRDIWGDVEVSVLKLAFGEIERELGFPLDHLDRFTMVMHSQDPGAGGGMAGSRKEIQVLEGNAELPVPDSVRGGRWQQEQVGKYQVWRRDTYRDRVFFRPRPELLVTGDLEVLRPALEGGQGAATPSADVMSLLSGRGAKLGYAVLDLGDPRMRQGFLREVLPGHEWPEDDLPTFFCLRLLATGELDDPHLTLEAVMRHRTGGGGLAVTEAAIEELLAKVRADSQMLIFRSILKKLEKRRDGTDLHLRLDLGRARVAVGQLAMLAVPFFVLSSDDAQVVEAKAAVQVELVKPKPAKPQPLKPKKKPKKKDG